MSINLQGNYISTQHILDALEGKSRYNQLKVSYQTRSALIEAVELQEYWSLSTDSGSLSFSLQYNDMKLALVCDEDCPEDSIQLLGSEVEPMHLHNFNNIKE